MLYSYKRFENELMCVVGVKRLTSFLDSFLFLQTDEMWDWDRLFTDVTSDLQQQQQPETEEAVKGT